MDSLPATFTVSVAFPIVGAPIRDAVVTVTGGKIESIKKAGPSGPTMTDLAAELDCERVALLPGLVNAHTHLEFSDLTQPLGTPGIGFAEWVRTVIAHREQMAADESVDLEQARQNAINSGLNESARAGTTTIGEIATMAGLRETYANSPLGGVVFLESLGMSDERIDAALHSTAAHQEEFTRTSVEKRGQAPSMLSDSKQHDPTVRGSDPFFQLWQSGISPHAPYSTHRDLLQALCETASERSRPLAMHLAESPEEIELLATHQGRLRQLIEDLGVWNPAGLLRSTMKYLQRLTTAGRSLVIHGNYLSDEEIDFVAQQPEMSVVYCPRTHAYFNHAPYPIRRLIDAGANVALGTDSRASNPDLSLWKEFQTAARQHPDVLPAELLHAATLGGATALGFGKSRGHLAPGAAADFCVVKLPDQTVADPHELLVDHDCQVVATICNGKQI